MAFIKHGLSIGIERIDNKLFLSLKALGTLTHQDYETITPMIEAALAEVKDPQVDVLLDASELEGWQLRAAWDDFKIGLKHNNKFRKIAIYGNQKWQQNIAVIGNWFISGELKYFQQAEPAIKWLQQ